MIYFLLGGITYAAYIALSSYKQAHDTYWYVPVGLCIALAANICWLYLTKSLKTPTDILLAAIWWDAMVVSISIAIPIVIFGANPTKWQVIGIILIIIGVILSHKT